MLVFLTITNQEYSKIPANVFNLVLNYSANQLGAKKSTTILSIYS